MAVFDLDWEIIGVLSAQQVSLSMALSVLQILLMARTHGVFRGVYGVFQEVLFPLSFILRMPGYFS